MSRSSFLGKKLLVSLICLFCGLLFVFWVISNYSHLDKNVRALNANVLDTIDQRMVSLFYEINSFPRGAANDILFLDKLSSLTTLLNSPNTGLSYRQQAQVLRQDLLEFIRENKAYYRIEYLDEKGQQVASVVFDGDEYSIEDRGDVSPRSYFEQAMLLDAGEILISPIKLSSQDGVLENRGSAKHPIYIPVIYYASPLFDDAAQRKGVLVSSVYADYFLDSIRNFQREGEHVFLIDADGYYLAHPQRAKEFGSLLGTNENFYRDYPEISSDALDDFGQRQFETEEYIFSFRHIYPTLGNFEAYKGLEKILGEESMQDYYWILVTVSDTSDMHQVSADLRREFWVSLFFFSLTTGAIVTLVLRLYRS